MIQRATYNVKRMFHVKHYTGGCLMDIFLHCLYAFLVGGFICLVGQVLIENFLFLFCKRVRISYRVACQQASVIIKINGAL